MTLREYAQFVKESLKLNDKGLWELDKRAGKQRLWMYRICALYADHDVIKAGGCVVDR